MSPLMYLHAAAAVIVAVYSLAFFYHDRTPVLLKKAIVVVSLISAVLAMDMGYTELAALQAIVLVMALIAFVRGGFDDGRLGSYAIPKT